MDSRIAARIVNEAMIVFVLYVFSLLIVQGLTEYLLTEVHRASPCITVHRSVGCGGFFDVSPTVARLTTCLRRVVCTAHKAMCNVVVKVR